MGYSRHAGARAPLIIVLVYSLVLAAVGYRLFVDAAAAVYYNADERIPAATELAWVYAAVWGLGNGAIGWLAFRRGVLGRGGWLRIAALELLVLDLTFLLVLSVRGGVDDVTSTAVYCLVAGALGTLAWRRPGIGGSLLVVGGAFLSWSALLGSASYEGEAEGLLFDEDLFFIVSLGLLPFCSGLLFVVARLWSRSARSLPADP